MTRDQTLWERTGGLTGLIQSSLPPVALVLTNSLWGLRPAIAAALGVAVLVTAARLTRRQSIRPAIGGFVGVAISGAIASRTGEARDFFLADIWWSLTACIALTASILLRRPLVGVVWNALRGVGAAWRHDPASRRAYDIATTVAAAVFAARFAVQQWLYLHNEVGWMAIAKIAMNYPLWAVVLLVAVWAARRSDHRLAYCHDHRSTVMR